MKNLLTATEQRRFDFIELLVKRKSWVDLSEVAVELACSERVLRNDLDYFKDLNHLFKISWSDYGIRIRLEPNVGMLTISQKFIENSDYYSLLEHIFFSQNKTVTVIASELYKSSATVYRMISTINSIFNHYDIYIDTKPIRITGNELNIRYYFFNYFTSKYGLMYFPFTQINDDVFDQLLKPFADHFNWKIGFSEMNNYKFGTAVNIIRYINGHLVDKSDNRKLRFDPLPAYEKRIAFLSELESSLRIKIDEQFIEQIFYLYLDTNYILDHSTLKEQVSTDANLSVKFVHLMIDFTVLQRGFNLELVNASELILNIMNSIYLAENKPFSDFILYDERKDFVEGVRQIAPSFLNHLEHYLMNDFKDYTAPLSRNNVNFLLYTIITHWENLIPQLLRQGNEINIAVISHHSQNFAQMISEFLSFELSENVSIALYNELNPNMTTLLNESYDMIVTDFPTRVQLPRLIYIEGIPDNQDFKKIHLTIDRIIQGRKNNRADID